MVRRVALLLLVSCVAAPPAPSGPDATTATPLGGTVYPTPPTGPCGGDMVGRFPNCIVASAAGGTVVFTDGGFVASSVIGLQYQGATGQTYVNSAFQSFNTDQLSGIYADLGFQGLVYSGDGGTRDILVPRALDMTFAFGGPSTQAKFFPKYKQWGQTFEAGTVVLTLPVAANTTCFFVARGIGLLKVLKPATFIYFQPVAQPGYVGASFSTEMLIGAENPGGAGAQAVGTGSVILNAAADANQSDSTLTISYSGGDVLLTATTTSNNGTVVWTLSAEGACN